MPEAARTRALEDVPVDPSAVEHAYRLHRAKRHARIERNRVRREARHRFALMLAFLSALAIFLALTSWHEIQKLFGL